MLAQLLQAAVVVEDVSLQGAAGGGELLAALRPAAGTLRALDTTHMADEARIFIRIILPVRHTDHSLQ